MSSTPGSLEHRLEQALAITDPEERLAAFPPVLSAGDEFNARVRRARALALHELRTAGRSWSYIGALLGTTPQRAQQIAATHNPGETT